MQKSISKKVYPGTLEDHIFINFPHISNFKKASVNPLEQNPGKNSHLIA